MPHEIDEQITKIKLLEELLLHVGDVSVWSKLFPKSLLKNNRFEEGKLNEDLLFMLQVLENIDYVNFVGSVGYYYFVREKSISSGYGKAVIDMQDNSLRVLEHVKLKYPKLKAQAKRFAIYQNMAFLLLIPREKTKYNDIYKRAIKFIRKNLFCAIFNRYLKIKQKIIVVGLFFAPKFVAKKHQAGHGKRK